MQYLDCVVVASLYTFSICVCKYYSLLVAEVVCTSNLCLSMGGGSVVMS